MKKATALLTAWIFWLWMITPAPAQTMIVGRHRQVKAGAATPAFVDAKSSATYINSAPGTVSAAAQNVTAGNGLIVGCGVNYLDATTTPSTSVSVTDTAGDTFTYAASKGEINGARGISVFYVKSSLGNASNVVVCHSTTTVAFVSAFAVQVSSPGNLDATPSGSQYNSSSTLTTGSFTTIRAAEIGLCFLNSSWSGTNNSFTAGSGYTIPVNGQVAYNTSQNFSAVEYQIFSSIQTSVTASMAASASPASIGSEMQCVTF